MDKNRVIRSSSKKDVIWIWAMILVLISIVIALGSVDVFEGLVALDQFNLLALLISIGVVFSIKSFFEKRNAYIQIR